MDFNLYNAVAFEHRLVFWVLPEANTLDIFWPETSGIWRLVHVKHIRLCIISFLQNLPFLHDLLAMLRFTEIVTGM